MSSAEALSVTLTVTEASRNLADVLNRVAYRGESFLLVRGKKPVAELRPVPAGRRLADLPALLADLPRLSPAEAEAFAADLDAARAEMATTEMPDPWAR